MVAASWYDCDYWRWLRVLLVTVVVVGVVDTSLFGRRVQARLR